VHAKMVKRTMNRRRKKVRAFGGKHGWTRGHYRVRPPVQGLQPELCFDACNYQAGMKDPDKGRPLKGYGVFVRSNHTRAWLE
jgi:hypothetical protein